MLGDKKPERTSAAPAAGDSGGGDLPADEPATAAEPEQPAEAAPAAPQAEAPAEAPTGAPDAGAAPAAPSQDDGQTALQGENAK